jgi:hypothetical protein
MSAAHAASRKISSVDPGDPFIAPIVLAAIVSNVRLALNAKRPRLLRTAPRLGHAFSGAVSEQQAVGAGGDAADCWLVLDDRRIELTEGANLIGRDPKARAWLDSPTVSR